RITTLAFLLATTVIPQLLYTPTLQADQPTRPNIILIMADDMGYGALGCYGQDQIKTPHIDQIADEGIQFTHFYAGSHVCQPSRSVLMTGLHSGHTPVRANDTRQFLLDSDVTLAERFKSAGYVTGGFGKWGLGYEGTSGHPNRQGFDQYFGQYLQVHAHFYYPYWLWQNDEKVMLDGNRTGMNQYVNDEIHDSAMEFIQSNHDKPFFAYVPYIIPHVEVVVPEESEIPYRGKFPKVAILDPRENYLGSEDGLTTLAGMISRMDDQVGEILQLLKELKIDENTLVIFTSDNGGQSGGKDAGWTKMTDYFQNNADLRGYKGTFYEGGIRVPFVARWPDQIAAGKVSDEPLAFWDVTPTLCEVIGADTPEVTDGISFLPTLTGDGEQESHEGLYWEYLSRRGLGRAARMGKWKGIHLAGQETIQLFDLDSDPGEERDVAAQHPEIVEQIQSFMDASHSDPRPYPGPVVPTSVRDFVNGPWIK
ncbi:arylsulfatase, partial [Thalassoglobus neptunius]